MINEKTKTRLLLALFAVTIAAACLVTGYAIRHFDSGLHTTQESDIISLSTGWQYQGADGRVEIPALPTTVPLDPADDGGPAAITLFYRLPDSLPRNPVLELLSRQSTVEVFLEGEALYTYGLGCETPVGMLLGNPRNVIVLPEDAAGKEISVRLTSPYFTDSYRLGRASLGSRSASMYQFVLSNLDLAVFCMFSIFFCMMTLFIAAFFRFKKVDQSRDSLLFFTLFILISGTWVITDSNLLQLLTSNFALVYFVSHLAFMLFPIPLMIFLRQTSLHRKSGYGLLALIFMAGFLIRIGLFFGGIADLETSLPLTHLLMVAGTVTAIALLAEEWYLYKDKTTLPFLISFVFLALCLVISLVVFTFSNEADYSVYFRIMLFLMMSAMFYKIIAQLEAMAKKGIETQLYQKLAYTDGLTGIPNRRAFEEQMALLQSGESSRMLTILVCDINRLKHVNDTYGHSAGDQLIKSAAENIRRSFGSIGNCYRIGGDEFAVILQDFPEANLKKILEDFHASVENTDAGNPDGLQVAVGYATGPANDEQLIHRLFDQADRAMYHNKTEHS